MMSYLSRARPHSSVLSNPAMARQLAEPYTFHQFVWRFFPKEKSRNFIYRWDGPERSQGLGTLWLLSQQEPTPVPGWEVASKPLDPRLSKGDRLRFSLRLNPVVRRNGKRHDVVMDTKRRLRAEQRSAEGTARKEPETVLAQTAVAEWIGKRAPSWGVLLQQGSLSVDSYRCLRFRKRKGGPKVQLGVCDVTGLWTIEEPELFLERWHQGFGAARSFGCGLLLAARA